MKWNRSLSTGIEKIDKGYEIWFNSINTLYRSLKRKKNLKIVSELFLGTIYVSTIHFINEEKFMKKYNYPELTKHMHEHNSIINQLINYKNQIEMGEKPENFLFSFDLKTMIFSHVNGLDKNFGHYLEKPGQYDYNLNYIHPDT